MKVTGPGSDAAAMKLLLADPGLNFTEGDSFRIRVLSGDTVLIDKEFAALLSVVEAVEPETGRIIRLFRQTERDLEKQVILKKFKLETGDKVRIRSRRGSIELPVWLRGRSTCPEGTVFVPFFDETKLINEVTLDAYCPMSKEPDYKKCAVKLEMI
jgi:hypothetical protein